MEGSVSSFPSSPSKPRPSSHIPMWEWASISPEEASLLRRPAPLTRPRLVRHESYRSDPAVPHVDVSVLDNRGVHREHPRVYDTHNPPSFKERAGRAGDPLLLALPDLTLPYLEPRREKPPCFPSTERLRSSIFSSLVCLNLGHHILKTAAVRPGGLPFKTAGPAR